MNVVMATRGSWLWVRRAGGFREGSAFSLGSCLPHQKKQQCIFEAFLSLFKREKYIVILQVTKKTYMNEAEFVVRRFNINNRSHTRF